MSCDADCCIEVQGFVATILIIQSTEHNTINYTSCSIFILCLLSSSQSYQGVIEYSTTVCLYLFVTTFTPCITRLLHLRSHRWLSFAHNSGRLLCDTTDTCIAAFALYKCAPITQNDLYFSATYLWHQLEVIVSSLSNFLPLFIYFFLFKSDSYDRTTPFKFNLTFEPTTSGSWTVHLMPLRCLF